MGDDKCIYSEALEWDWRDGMSIAEGAPARAGDKVDVRDYPGHLVALMVCTESRSVALSDNSYFFDFTNCPWMPTQPKSNPVFYTGDLDIIKVDNFPLMVAFPGDIYGFHWLRANASANMAVITSLEIHGAFVVQQKAEYTYDGPYEYQQDPFWFM